MWGIVVGCPRTGSLNRPDSAHNARPVQVVHHHLCMTAVSPNFAPPSRRTVSLWRRAFDIYLISDLSALGSRRSPQGRRSQNRERRQCRSPPHRTRTHPLALEHVQLELNHGGFPTGREYDLRCMLEAEATCMARAYSLDLRERVIAAVRSGQSCRGWQRHSGSARPRS